MRSIGGPVAVAEEDMNPQRQLRRKMSPDVAERKPIMGTRALSHASRGLPFFLIVLCVGTFTLSRQATAGQGPLDGKTFSVETGEKGKAAKDKDTIMFRDGNFRSKGCDRYGFGDGPYTSTVTGDTIRFEAVTTSPAKGTMTWTGTVQGDRIKVGYVWVDSSHWYKPNPKPVEKWAQGELKKP